MLSRAASHSVPRLLTCCGSVSSTHAASSIPVIAAGFVPAEPVRGQDWPKATPQGRGLDAGGGRHILGWRRVGGLELGHVDLRRGLDLACAGGAGAQPYLGPRDFHGLGDMMIDGVIPLGVWPRRSFGAVRARAVPGAASRRNAGRRPRGMATVHRLCEGCRVHPHRCHRPARTGA